MDKKNKSSDLNQYQEAANEFELRKLELAQKDKQAEAELTFKLKELESNIKREKNSFFASPVLIAILTASAGLLGTGMGAVLQGYWTTQLERQKFESSLIAKAVETNDKAEAAKSLTFLIDTGIIQSLKKENVQKFIDNPETIPLATTGTIGLGSSGTEVLNIQNRLVELGYLDKIVSKDGFFGDRSVAALRLFQKNHKLPETGVIDETTKQKLFEDKSKLVDPNGQPYK